MTDRRFTGRQREALFLAVQGRCEDCGAELKVGWHGDHQLAWAAGGETDVVNGAALCPPCNLARQARDATGAPTGGLRAWQRRALDAYELTVPRDFLVVATPGAGKTRLAGTVTGRHLRAGRAELVVVVVPSERLKGQWADTIAGCGVQLEPDWTNSDGALPAGMDGVCVTYAQVAAAPDLFRHHTARRAAVCVFDEIHHCGDTRSWGDAIRHAFEPATWRVALSGTPFRSDNNAIPFVRYVDGVGQPDITYDYGEAIADGVCRPVFFPRRGGRMEWATGDGTIVEATFDDDIDVTLINQRLRTALAPAGDWLAAVLDDAHDELCALRATVPDAAGLVVAADQAHARHIAELLRARHRVDPVVVTSDEPGANDRIEHFTAGNAPWLVAVRMVSEGVDIPRLRVGVYATPITTELFFRQAVGRLVRVGDPDAGETASCYIPDDPRLRRYAATIAEQRDHVLDDETDKLLDDQRTGGGGGGPVGRFQPIAAEATDVGGTFDGAEFTPAELTYAATVKARSPQTAALPTPTVATILRFAGRQPDANPDLVVITEPPAHRRRQALRAANHRAVGRIAYASGIGHAEVNTALNSAVGIAAVASASAEDLEARLRAAQQWLAAGRPPGGPPAP